MMAAPTSAVLRDSAPPLIEDVYRAAYAGGAGGACRRMLALREELQRSARIPVVGERSRGKSRLINAMLRRPGLLPVDIDVASNVFVVITHAGEGEEHVEVRFGDGQESRRVPVGELEQYASENGNAGNVKGVQSVTVHLQSPLLAAGIELYDTPGVGGLISEHGSIALEVTRQADGLIMVLEAAKPVSKPEIDFISMVAGRASDTPVVFCLTKIDQYQGQNIDEMTSFLREALARHAPTLSDSPVVCVSAIRAERSLECRETEPDRADELAGQSGMGALLDAISTHVLGAIERDRYVALLEEGRRVTDELARPHRERLAVLEDGVDPQARLNQVRRQLAALPDSRALRARLDQELQALYRRMNRTLAKHLQAMNHDLEDQIEFRWKKSMRRTLPNAYDQRFREIWLEVVNDLSEGAAAIAAERSHAYARTGGELEPEDPDAPRSSGEIAQTPRLGKRLRGWMKIIWLSFVSLGFLFPAQYMEHRDAMRSADQNDARRWLRRSIALQAAYYDELRAHAERVSLTVLAVVEPPVLDRRRSLEATAAALEDIAAAGGVAEIERDLDRLRTLAAGVDRLLTAA